MYQPIRRDILCPSMLSAPRHAALVAVAAIAVGCRTIPEPPVQLQGDPVSIAALAGSWTGDFWGGPSGLGGSMSFTLHGGTAGLQGDVRLDDPRQQQNGFARKIDGPGVRTQAVERFHIRLVAVEGDDVGAVLEPYVGADCGCLVTTTFVGRVIGDRITGTYLTRAGGRVLAQGSWQMTRVDHAR